MRLLFPTLALLLATPAHAAPPRDEEEEQTVCITSLTLWYGSTEDIRRLRELPVPHSYRQLFNTGGPCGRGTLSEPTLIDAHLAFGDEASVAAALAFLAEDHMRDLPAPARFAGLLGAAKRAAAADLAAARAVPREPAQVNYLAVRRILLRPSVARLRALVLAQQDYMFLARQYLRAADFHRSRALYDRALLYFAPALAGFHMLYGDRQPMADAVSFVEGGTGLQTEHINDMHDLEMRMALLLAGLTRSPADVAAAQAVVARNHDNLLDEAVDRVADNRDPCDAEDRDNLTPVEAACRAESNFGRRLGDYWLARARLDLLLAADPARYGLPAAPPRWPEIDSYDKAQALLAWERRRYGRSSLYPRYTAEDDAEVQLRLLRADLFARLARARAGRVTDWQAQEAHDARGLRDAALNDFAAAARIAVPSRSAGRFRQAATGFLQASTAVPGPPGDAALEREGAYFRTVLANLDKIVRADP